MPCLKFNPDWEIPPLSGNEKKEIEKILQTSWNYLDHGNQCYVFESGEYVLKLFRYRCTRFPFIEKTKRCIESLYKPKPKDDFLLKANKTFEAVRLACVEGKEFTQVVFCHLNLTRNELPTSEFKVGSSLYRLPLDRYRFAIQKKVVPFEQAMFAAKNDSALMREYINSLVKLFIQRSAKGIRNSDPNLRPNFGFLGNCAIEMDFGNYRRNEDPDLRQKEIDSFVARLRHWLKKNAPESAVYLDKNL